MTSSLKKDQCKTRSINFNWYGINSRNVFRGGICHAFHKYVKTNKK